MYSDLRALEIKLAKGPLPEGPKKLTFNNRKTCHSFRSPVLYCTHRTPVCSQHCYAARIPMTFPDTVKKTLAVRRWIEENGVEAAARRMATEIPWKGLFRWMDQGDFDPLTVELANKLVPHRPDVNYVAFSRNLDALRHLNPHISRLWSLDKSSKHLITTPHRGIKVAYLKVDEDDEPPLGTHVVFPLNKRKALTGHRKDCTFSRIKNATCSSCLRCFGKR